MDILGLVLASLLPASLMAAETPATANEKPKIGSLLLDEAYRPEQAPVKGQTVWDFVEQAVYKTRKARQIYKDARRWSTGIDRPEADWKALDQRLSQLEAAYQDSLWPGLSSLGRSFNAIRPTCTGLDLLLQEREFYAQLVKPSGAKGAFTGEPAADGLKAARMYREEAEGEAVAAEERLGKGLDRLRKAKPSLSPIQWYLEDMLGDAEEEMERAAVKALELAKAQAALSRKNGLFGQAIAAVQAYGGPDGKGVYEEATRAKAVELSNAAKKLLVVNEYTMASRPEESRTMEYLLDRFGRL